MKFSSTLLANAFHKKKFNVVTETAKILHSDKPDIFVSEYCGDNIRMFVNKDNAIRLMLPKNIDCIQENTIADAIASGDIFDDAETLSNTCKYINMTALPHTAICNKGKVVPTDKLDYTLTGIVGTFDDNGHCNCDDGNIRNGYNYIKDIVNNPLTDGKMLSLTEKYLGNTNDEEDFIDSELRKEIASMQRDIEDVNDIDIDDEITDSDFDFIDVDDDIYGDYEQESFITKRPKKLKPIPRDIISYITIECNAIQDSNDQAMLSGYTCAKLELVDFYLNCIDTNDARYVVPHDRAYLVNMQKQLSDLLSKILRVRPINRNDRVWQINVNYPEGWRG